MIFCPSGIDSDTVFYCDKLFIWSFLLDVLRWCIHDLLSDEMIGGFWAIPVMTLDCLFGTGSVRAGFVEGKRSYVSSSTLTTRFSTMLFIFVNGANVWHSSWFWLSSALSLRFFSHYTLSWVYGLVPLGQSLDLSWFPW